MKILFATGTPYVELKPQKGTGFWPHDTSRLQLARNARELRNVLARHFTIRLTRGQSPLQGEYVLDPATIDMATARMLLGE